MIKSGTDFRNMSKIIVQWTESGLDITLDRVDLDSSIEEDPDMKKEVTRLFGEHVLYSLHAPNDKLHTVISLGYLSMVVF